MARDDGFSLAEVLVSVAILMAIASVVASAMLKMSTLQQSIWNRTEMHAGVRSATELMQQEVGQAGRVAFPTAVTLTGAVPGAGANTVGVSAVASMFVGELLTVDGGMNQETVAVTAVDTANSRITAAFTLAHAANVPVEAFGGFATGIVPATTLNGSTGSALKMYGDINGDGTLVYVEYTCDTVAGNLYRNVVAYNAVAKPAVTAAQVLVSGIRANPANAPCFTYQTKSVNGVTFVVDVAITLTVQTLQKDPVTKQYQTETKALLNVAPRNVYDAWQLAASGALNRVQPMPPSIVGLLQ